MLLMPATKKFGGNVKKGTNGRQQLIKELMAGAVPTVQKRKNEIVETLSTPTSIAIPINQKRLNIA